MKGWFTFKAGQSKTVWDFIRLLRMVCNLKHELFTYGIFHLMVSDHGWLWVTKTTNKGEPLYSAEERRIVCCHLVERNLEIFKKGRGVADAQNTNFFIWKIWHVNSLKKAPLKWVLTLKNKIQPRKFWALIGFTNESMNGAASHLAHRSVLLGFVPCERFLQEAEGCVRGVISKRRKKIF